MIRIVTDSAADLAPDVAAAAGITVVPLTVRFGEQEFVSGEQLSVEEFWARLEGSDITPSTAAPSVGRFQQAFDGLADAGADGIVAALMSSKISATHQSATLAAQGWDRIPVRVVDSGVVSAALGLSVLAGAEAAEQGDSLDSVASTISDAAARSNFFAALDTLEYLKRGGRIGGARALIAGLLDIKPLIAFDEGEVTAAGRVRTRGKAVTAVVDHVAGLGDQIEALAVVHSAPDRVAEFTERLVGAWPGGTPDVVRLGPVVGTHGGPGVLGVAYRLAATSMVDDAAG